ncbi:hypothetical protein COCNU_02G007580 [Cocos nucifera]|uniref:Uncharacterized protein n=1 Tax=Cocos nucifera TaxID=13894 RepID=A0A8K0HZ08_COCNU|nr:hypothetical protein COCNU_02G007580 [Cocos nucifera]
MMAWRKEGLQKYFVIFLNQDLSTKQADYRIAISASNICSAVHSNICDSPIQQFLDLLTYISMSRIEVASQVGDIQVKRALGAFIMRTMARSHQSYWINSVVQNDPLVMLLFVASSLLIFGAWLVSKRRRPQLKTIYDLEKDFFSFSREASAVIEILAFVIHAGNVKSRCSGEKELTMGDHLVFNVDPLVKTETVDSQARKASESSGDTVHVSLPSVASSSVVVSVGDEGKDYSGTPLDLRDPQLLAMAAARRRFLEAEYDEYAATNASGAAFCRSAALIVSLMLPWKYK